MEISVFHFALMIIVMFISSYAGLSFACTIPWSADARKAGIPHAFGLAIAPFILGLIVVLILRFMPGLEHNKHLCLILIIMVTLCLPKFIYKNKSKMKVTLTSNKLELWDWVFLILLGYAILLLLKNTLLIPLIQNDALEYAIVGRVLFATRDLLSYPVLDTVSSNGFYGPWTHPPLYVALIYMMQLLQRHADFPELIRYIAPWATLVATYLVYAIGLTHHRTIGIISALIFISAPLFNLGASGGLIDALPVLGMTLILCSVVMVEGSILQLGIIQGIILGFALWTHSETILFVPLAIIAIVVHNFGRNQFNIYLKQIFVMLIVALLIAIWPYLHNMNLYGSIVSDNNIVFKLPSLNWAGYFSVARGYDTWVDIIQKGLFKGWFMIESYGLAFWFMTMGVVFYIRRMCPIAGISRYSSVCNTSSRLGLVVLAIIGCYLSGMLVSILLHIDLMIRNDRYLLVLMPCVSLMAGYGIYNFITIVEWKLKDVCHWQWPHMFSALGVVILIIQLLIMNSNNSKLRDHIGGNTRITFYEKLLKWSYFRAMIYLDIYTEPEAIVLSMKPADMYYANRRMVSYLDPKLLPFYKEKDVIKAKQQLINLGIRYLHIINYALPPIYNSALQEIINNPRLAGLVYDSDGIQIYDLYKTINSEKYNFNSMAILAIGKVWEKLYIANFGSKKAFLEYTLCLAKTKNILSDNDECARLSSSASSIMLWLGKDFRQVTGDLRAINNKLIFKQNEEGVIAVRGQHKYQFDILFKGYGLGKIYIKQYTADYVLLKTMQNFTSYQAGEILLDMQDKERLFSKQIITYKDASYLKIGIKYPQNKLKIKMISFQEIQ